MLRTIVGLMAMVFAAQNDSAEKPSDKEFRGQDAQRVAAWHYAVAPFTDYALAVPCDGKEVWSLAKGHRPTRGTAHWWNGRVESKTLSAEDEAKLAKSFKASQAIE